MLHDPTYLSIDTYWVLDFTGDKIYFVFYSFFLLKINIQHTREIELGYEPWIGGCLVGNGK
jgi:hypothetical protein